MVAQPRRRRRQACALAQRAPPVLAQARRGLRLLAARSGAVDADGRLGRVRGRRAAHGRHVVEQRAVGVMTDRRDHRHAQQRHGAAERLVAEAQQVGQRAAAARDDHDVDSGDSGEVAERTDDRRRRVAVLHGGEAPHQAPCPSAPRERRRDIVAGLALLAGDHADSAGQERELEPLLRLEQALAVELLAQPVDPSQQVALACHAQIGDGEAEARRGGGAARVVVAAAGHHHLHALGRRAAARAPRSSPSPCATQRTAVRRWRREARSRRAREKGAG